MGSILLPRDFREFLQLLNDSRVEYLLIGGYAVGYHGYPRATGDLELWVASSPDNAAKLVEVLIRFGFSAAAVSPELFLRENQVIRMGLPPVRIELHTAISGVDFRDCYARRTVDVLDGVEVPILSLPDLKANKQASGRLKDLSDLENLA